MFRIVPARIGAFLESLFAVLNAARLVPAAIESRRVPSAAALRTLGISLEAYRSIRVL